MYCRFWPLLCGWLAPGSLSGTWHFYSKTENPNEYVIYFIADTSNISNSELLQRLGIWSNTHTNTHILCTYKLTFKIWANFFCPFVTSCLYSFSQAGKLSSFGFIFTKWLCLVSSSYVSPSRATIVVFSLSILNLSSSLPEASSFPLVPSVHWWSLNTAPFLFVSSDFLWEDIK